MAAGEYRLLQAILFCAQGTGLFAVGKMASVVARGARGAGLDRVIEFPDVEAAAAAVKRFIKKGDVLLLKASQCIRNVRGLARSECC